MFLVYVFCQATQVICICIHANLFLSIIGEAVAVEDEVVVINSVVLPNKTLNVSVQEEIIL
jgi:mannose-1-phosphate guanylyltransferase